MMSRLYALWKFSVVYCLLITSMNCSAVSYWEQLFGSMPLSAENEQFIRAIARDMHAPANIIIRKMNFSGIKILGERNACAITSLTGGAPYIFVSEGFFDSLCEEEKRFLIAHEVAHITKHHTLFLSLANISFIAFNYLLFQHMNKPLEGETGGRIIKGLGACMASLASFLGMQYYKRIYVEKVADRIALEQFHCYEGCQSFLDKTEQPELEKQPYVWLLLDHPSHAQRRAWCAALQKQAASEQQ